MYVVDLSVPDGGFECSNVVVWVGRVEEINQRFRMGRGGEIIGWRNILIGIIFDECL